MNQAQPKPAKQPSHEYHLHIPCETAQWYESFSLHHNYKNVQAVIVSILKTFQSHVDDFHSKQIARYSIEDEIDDMFNELKYAEPQPQDVAPHKAKRPRNPNII